ncbi:MAG TPA: aminoacyl-tRNA hydrolase [Chitinophagaceae bacterium]|nr:MAG: peptidyl-tRNA hydrolase [Bacteroidetes bacterium OLB11]HMN32852.1 aminoacyl-tRNA hydrolase [Chitinophagaceae bacterium]
MKYLIVGLGNIGEQYAETRHNIGFDILNYFAGKHQFSFKSDRLADVGEIKFKGRTLIMIKPTTYMNLSGKAVKYWADKEKIPNDRILILVDDLAFGLDALKLKKNGSDAGHNGLKSIAECLATTDYPRLRFGIGNQFNKNRQVEFVLGKWKDEEIETVNKKIIAAAEVIENFVTIGIERTMNEINNKKF